MTHSLKLVPLLALFALSTTGCPSTAPDVGAACTKSVDCPEGHSCVDGHCKAGEPGEDDAGGQDPLDAGSQDAGSQGGRPDASISDPDNPTKDTDCDGLSDAVEFSSSYHGQKTDPNNPDTDGDGIPDGVEVGVSGAVEGTACTVSGDQDPTSITSPTTPDSDGDGVPDGAEDANHNGRVDSGETDPNGGDSDGDGLTDGKEDKDGDGTVDPGESDPRLRDSDADLIPDGIEDANLNGAVDANETDPSKADTDGDGCLDGVEDKNWNHAVERPGETDPLDATDCGPALGRDTDCDGIPDRDEPTYSTDPNDDDSDDDGLEDGLELGVATNPDPTHCSSFQQDLDSATRTNPTRADSDCDGLSDGQEDPNANGRRDSGETDPTRPDTDGDGLLDGIERGSCNNPDAACTAFRPDANCAQTTDPNNPDSDGDGIADGAEDSNQNGAHESGELDPTNAADGSGAANQACSTANLRPVSIHEAIPADVRVAATSDFTEIAHPRVNGVEKAVMLYDPTHKVAGFALVTAPTGANAAADETAGRGILGHVGTVSNPVSQTFTTWDNYGAAHGFYDLSGSGDLKTVVNDIAGRYLGSVTDLPGSAANVGGPFKVEAEFVRRSSTRTVVVMAIMPASLWNASKPYFLSDLGGGSALAQFGDSNAAQCEVFQTQPPPKVDFVWVVDNSGSMEDYQTAVARAGTTMINKLQNAAIDWRMAATTSSYYTVYSSTSLPDGFRPFTTNQRTILDWFTSYATGWFNTSGDSEERLLQSAKDLTTDQLLPATAGSDLKLRPGATLVFIIMGDADDQSITSAANYETFFRNYDTHGAAAQLHGIVCPDGMSCGESQHNPHKNLATINLMNGIYGNIDSANNNGSLEPTIEAIINAAIAGVSPYSTQKPPIASTIKLAIDPAAFGGSPACTASDIPRDRTNGFDFDGVTRRILFFGNCRPTVAGQRAAVSYRYWTDLTSDPNGKPDPCGGACEEPFVCDTATNTCVCPSDCGATSPGATYMCEPNSCTWVCSPDCNGCGANELCNSSTCQCACNQTMTCGVGFRFDATLCACVCDTASLSCDGLLQVDEEVCGCVCPTDCGGCEEHQTCNPSLCRCVGGPT